jgi:hypothetical protein
MSDKLQHRPVRRVFKLYIKDKLGRETENFPAGSPLRNSIGVE